jgi:predicted aldo/keto reductase-like oxidoreductase
MQHVEETHESPPTHCPNEEHRNAIAEHLDRLQKMAGLYCTGCNCKPCPNEVDIPASSNDGHAARIYGLWIAGRAMPADGEEARGDACLQCGGTSRSAPSISRSASNSRSRTAHWRRS